MAVEKNGWHGFAVESYNRVDNPIIAHREINRVNLGWKLLHTHALFLKAPDF